MQTHMIMNEIDNAENQDELRAALEVIGDDIAAQFVAAYNAALDNPYCEHISLIGFMGEVEHKALDMRAHQRASS
jgi:hypothetical protein